jgi:hypothetical protein
LLSIGVKNSLSKIVQVFQYTPCVDGRIILKWVLKKWDWRGGTDEIGVAQDRDRWWVLANAVMNLRVP